jgi:hypothetical protein
MSNDLSRQIRALSETFVRSVIAAIHAGSLEDIVSDGGDGPSVKRGPGRPRKSAAASVIATNVSTNATRSSVRTAGAGTASTVEAIVAYVKEHAGSNGETTRKALGLARNRWLAAVTKAVSAGKLRTQGEKRSRRYWVA